MDLFVDDCRALSDEDWITGTNSGTHLKVVARIIFLSEKLLNFICPLLQSCMYTCVLGVPVVHRSQV